MTNVKDAHYYVATLDVGATECRLAVQLLDANGRPVGPAQVCVQQQREIGEGYVSNIEVSTRAVTQVVARMSKSLGFDIKSMSVMLMAGETVTCEYSREMQCTETMPGTTSRVVTSSTMDQIQTQSLQWKNNEESSGEWVVVYNRPVRYYTKEGNVKRIRTTPEGTCTEIICSDWIGVKVKAEYLRRFTTVLGNAKIDLKKWYVEGLASAVQRVENAQYGDCYLHLHLGYTKSVLLEVFDRNGELNLSHHARLFGIGTKFSEYYGMKVACCTHDYVYETLKKYVHFDGINYEEAELIKMAGKGTYSDEQMATVTIFASLVVSELVKELIVVIRKWYPLAQSPNARIYLRLSGGFAGHKGLAEWIKTCFEKEEELRIAQVEVSSDLMSYKVISAQNGPSVKEETLQEVLGALRQEVACREWEPIEASEKNEPQAGLSDSGDNGGADTDCAPEGVPKSGRGIRSVIDWLQNSALRGPKKPIV